MPGKRKPHAIKVIEDSRWKDTDSEPNVEPAIPTMPQHIVNDEEAKKEWKRIAPLLKNAGLLTLIDRAALAAYCQLWSRWSSAENNILTNGVIIPAPSGYPIVNPALSIANSSMKLMVKFLGEFGMSPSSRTRVAISGEQESGNSFDDLLSKN